MLDLSPGEPEERQNKGVTKGQPGTNLPNTPSMIACCSKDYASRFGSNVSGSVQVSNIPKVVAMDANLKLWWSHRGLLPVWRRLLLSAILKRIPW